MNAIFQEIGFTTAEAAIPVIGLQAAMETVSVAADGSTSKLQELLGSSEAVTAVLAVTGEKAEAFAQTLNTVENAAGNTERAYDIMQRGIGRSFGRLTEAFDRLGNLFGEMGSKIVKPFVDILGDLVSSLVNIFSVLTPMAVTLGKAISKMLSVFDIPFVGAFVKGLVALAIAMAAILGFLGPLIWGIGQLMVTLALHIALQAFTKALLFATKFMGLLQVAMAKNVIVASILGPVLRGVEKALHFVGVAAVKTGVAIFAAFAAVAIFTAAAFAAVKVFTLWREAAEEAAKQNDIFGDGVSRLLDSAGIVENDLPRAFNAVEGSIEDVRDKNFRLIRELKEVKGDLGDIGASAVLTNIGASLVWKGATPEEAWNLIHDLGSLSGVKVNINLDDFTEGVEGVAISFEGLEAQAQRVANFIENMPHVILSSVGQDSGFDTMTDNLAQALVVATNIGELPLMKGELDAIAGIITDPEQLNELLETTIKKMEILDGETYDINLGNLNDVEDLFQIFADLDKIASDNEGKPIFEMPAIDTDLAKDLDIEAAAEASLETLSKLPPKIEGVITLVGEQGTVLQQLWADMDSAFAAANAHINDSQASITANLQAQIPVFAEYTEAVALSASSLADSAAAWAADIQVVADGTELLADNLTPAEIKIFNEQSVAAQASFFKGHTEAIASDAKTGKETAEGMFLDLKTTLSTLGLEDIKIASEIDRILGEADTILETALTALITTAETAGAAVPAAFVIKFNAGKRAMGTAATDYMTTLEGIVGADISGPTITAPTFIGGSTTYTVNVTASPTSNPGQSVSRALQTVGAGVQP
jgi:hypothetical protein